MTSNSSLIFLISLLTITLLPFPSIALTYQNQNILSAIIGGTVLCIDSSLSVTKTCKTIPNAPIELRCGTGSAEKVIKTGVTDLTGTYILAVSVLDTLLFDPNTCYIRVNLAGTSCSLALPTASLYIPLRVINVVQALVGNILVLTGGSCTYHN